MSPARPKASIEETAHGLEVVIPARRNGFATAFLGFWLCGWAVGETMVVGVLLTGAESAPATLFLLGWLGAWTIGGGFALYAFLWALRGRERILVTPSRLVIVRELFGMGRPREYELSHVRDLRVAPSAGSPSDFRSGMQFWGMGGGPIAFDHGAATVRFGAALDEGEAKMVVERLRSRASFR